MALLDGSGLCTRKLPTEGLAGSYFVGTPLYGALPNGEGEGFEEELGLLRAMGVGLPSWALLLLVL